jgi:hypothetical protein
MKHFDAIQYDYRYVQRRSCAHHPSRVGRASGGPPHQHGPNESDQSRAFYWAAARQVLVVRRP